MNQTRGELRQERLESKALFQLRTRSRVPAPVLEQPRDQQRLNAYDDGGGDEVP
jgi:hypothetical protein